MTVLIVGTCGCNSVISGFVPVAVAQNGKLCDGLDESRSLGRDCMSLTGVGWLAFIHITTTALHFCQVLADSRMRLSVINATQQMVNETRPKPSRRVFVF